MAVVAATLGFAPWALEPFHAFKAVALRAIGVPLLAWFAVEFVSGRVVLPLSFVLSVLGWLGANALATVFSIAPHLSVSGELSQREGLLTTLALAGLALGAAHAHRDERHVRGTLVTVLACGVLAAAYAQLQLAGLDPIHWAGMQTYAAQGSVALRPAGPLGNAILLGVALAAVLPLALTWLASRGSRGSGSGDAAWLVPAAALVAASLVMTLSRGAWLAAAVGAAAGVALACAAGGSARRAAWTTAASLAPAIALGVLRAAGPIAARLAEGAQGHSLAERAVIARGALQLWHERPWLGVGPDAFAVAFPRVQDVALWRDEWIGVPTNAHAAALQVLATLGIAGALAGLAWLVAAAVEWRLSWRETPEARATLAAIAGLLVALCAAGATNVVGLAGATLFAVCGALPIAMRARPERGARRLHPALPAIVATAVFLLVLESGARELAALALAQPAREDPVLGDATPEAWQAMLTARADAAWGASVDLPGEETLWRLACDATLAESDVLPASEGYTAALLAERAARTALALVPARAVNVERLANALGTRALRGGSASLADSAHALFERAATMAPSDGWLLVSQARFELARRDGPHALAVAQKLVALYPEAALGHTLSGAALLLLGRTDAARAALLHAMAARWEEDAGPQRAAAERLLQSLAPASAFSSPRP